jgi:hypothetical protein
MYKLERSYGKNTFDEWLKTQPSNLRWTLTDTETANQEEWKVSSFTELLECAAFLGTMNKRLVLFYRGQTRDWALLPTLFRDSWKPFDSKKTATITPENRENYWIKLGDIGERVYQIFAHTSSLGLPRRGEFHNTREIQWAVIQHYGLWPTPLLDITSSLRVAATFAMDFQRGSKENPKSGFLYVVAMPYSTGSITFDHDQQITLARLQSACPPIARRPHYQDGFLVGHFPIYKMIGALERRSNLKRRLVAKFKLQDNGDFWDQNFPIFRKTALVPERDDHLDRKAGVIIFIRR